MFLHSAKSPERPKQVDVYHTAFSWHLRAHWSAGTSLMGMMEFVVVQGYWSLGFFLNEIISYLK